MKVKIYINNLLSIFAPKFIALSIRLQLILSIITNHPLLIFLVLIIFGTKFYPPKKQI